MLGPYRDPAPTEAPLPFTCVPEGGPSSCCPALAARRTALVTRPPGALHAFTRALTAAATLLLLVCSASVSAITWTVTSTILAARMPRGADDARLDMAQAPKSDVPRGPSALTGLGTDTHDVDALWSRAQWRAKWRSELTLARATLAPGALAGGTGAAQIVRDPRGGLGVVDLDPSSAAAMIGLRRGDLVTAVNGFALRRPEDAKRAWAAVTAGRGAVVELLRDGRAVALRIDWTS